MEENREGHGLAEGKILSIWMILFVVLVLLPSVFRVSLGISHLYVKIVIKMLEWATLQIEEGVKKQKALALENLISTGIVQREEASMEEAIAGHCQGCFNLADVMYFSKKGCEAVAEDEVTQRFSSEELVSWNLLSRTNADLHHVSWQLTIVWVVGILIRYCLLVPFRICLSVFSILLLVLVTTVVGRFPNGRIKCWLSNQVQMICATLGVRCVGGLVHFHNRENKPRGGGICVANHTSPLDVLILASDGCYSLVGQAHGGLLGLIQKSCMQTSQHVLFERSEMKDRHLVRKKIREHIADKAKLPILIFPEGTCINNTSVMMFKKGSFEVGGTIHPVAIKYDPRFADAFWNSTKYSMMTYAFNVMTSWAIVCNVWYLPPMIKEEEEDAVHFANRVKAVIAARGGMSVLPWDGGLKRKKVKESFKEEQQKKYCQIVIENGSVGNRNVC
ncbi:glycerol-3-phosphate acyltransferase 3-like isoform X2 [Falco biarmicus]|uniref:glycerol-3-phosphate acyltransferase 3 isoform X2 n=2 Tax=Falco cherrug TaxID=345164 RepID=UPI000392ED17|nr:glycerol-3-phosphate acyltransferase 3 isoform X2 [Falco cherrug]XP_040438598.1 glycerol-3-phosphate acyltransferase 3-like isoform X2 [Falco naumanni]XP_055651315.1 glycerol-3-phosphate acyltransferase 3 isoform X2 [Falco peregrinus]XP_056216586.1 glycerol-3-phosphate acyltransferase 3-like isoform X2 [Falco biarmicus]